MAQFSFDCVSDYDKAEMNNVFDQVQREISSRYDFKGTSASIDWLDDKQGLKITGDNQFQLDSIIDMVRKKAASRGLSQKTFDTSSKEPVTSNLKMSWEVSFVKSLSADKAKKITNLLREKLPKVKAQIQGEEVRIMSPKKDELQLAMQLLREASFDFPISFTNFR
jgi:uncharacterized protein YajQ (UPF0234 family)